MKHLWKASAIALLALLILVPGGLARAADRDDGFRGPDRDFRGFYHPGYFAGPYGYGFGLGWPGLWGGGWGWGWGWGPPYFPPPRTGQVKIQTTQKDALVYVDGGYVGRAGKVKKLELRPGNHVIDLRNPNGHTFYQERVYVIRGKTVKLDADYPNQPSQAEATHSRAAPAVQGNSGPAEASGPAPQPRG
jgi:hypothetical protein